MLKPNISTSAMLDQLRGTNDGSDDTSQPRNQGLSHLHMVKNKQ